MGIKQSCDRCGAESVRPDFNPDDAFQWVTIKEQSYLLCLKCEQGYDALFAACQAKTEDIIFQWVNKGGKGWKILF